MCGDPTLRDKLLSGHSKHLSSFFPRCFSLRRLRQLHAQLFLYGLHHSAVFGSRLAHAYFELDAPRHAQQAFDQIHMKTPHSWNTMLSGYFSTHNLADLLRLYKISRARNHRPDTFSLAFGLRACVGLFLFDFGRSIHSEAIRSNLDLAEYVVVPLINMYVELGTMEDAEKVLRRVPPGIPTVWGLMMKSYVMASLDVKIFDLFHQMKELGRELDQLSAVYLVRACGNIQAAKAGCMLHAICLKKNFLEACIHLETSLVDMYGKSGMVDSAKKMFDEMPCKDVVSWSSMVASLAQCGRAWESLHLLRDMFDQSILPNAVTLATALLACSNLGALQQGKSVHAYMVRNNVELDVVSNTALLDMYAKCGSMEVAHKVFADMPERNVFSWSAMIGGLGMHGMCSRALELFEHMKSENLAPNSVTFVAVLSACSHSGRVEEGRRYFKSMTEDYKLNPKHEHYTCMVDLLARAGLLEEAESLIKEMPIEAGPSVWGAFLGACRIHKQIDKAKQVADKLFVLEPDQRGAHVLLSNIYATAEMWDMVKNTRELMSKRDLQKTVGFSTIEVDKRVYVFDAIGRTRASLSSGTS
ncbi:unnamed protein product [Musa banksii]